MEGELGSSYVVRVYMYLMVCICLDIVSNGVNRHIEWDLYRKNFSTDGRVHTAHVHSSGNRMTTDKLNALEGWSIDAV